VQRFVGSAYNKSAAVKMRSCPAIAGNGQCSQRAAWHPTAQAGRARMNDSPENIRRRDGPSVGASASGTSFLMGPLKSIPGRERHESVEFQHCRPETSWRTRKGEPVPLSERERRVSSRAHSIARRRNRTAPPHRKGRRTTPCFAGGRRGDNGLSLHGRKGSDRFRGVVRR
jgi:hypothetical protein